MGMSNLPLTAAGERARNGGVLVVGTMANPWVAGGDQFFDFRQRQISRQLDGEGPENDSASRSP